MNCVLDCISLIVRPTLHISGKEYEKPLSVKYLLHNNSLGKLFDC